MLASHDVSNFNKEIIMSGEYVIYQGRTIPKAGFRAFIYSTDGAQKLVESWSEFEREIASGVWFSTKNEALLKKTSKKGRK